MSGSCLLQDAQVFVYQSCSVLTNPLFNAKTLFPVAGCASACLSMLVRPEFRLGTPAGSSTAWNTVRWDSYPPVGITYNILHRGYSWHVGIRTKQSEPEKADDVRVKHQEDQIPDGNTGSKRELISSDFSSTVQTKTNTWGLGSGKLFKYETAIRHWVHCTWNWIRVIGTVLQWRDMRPAGRGFVFPKLINIESHH
jgi:hypothetical protein